MHGGESAHEREANRISSRLAELAGVMNVVVAEMVDLVGQADESGAWSGYRSIEQWLLLQTGLSSPRASKWARIARLLRERPALRDSFAAGELSEDQVAAVARIPVHNEAEITEMAREASVPQLKRIMSSYTFPKPDDPVAEAGSDEERRRVSFGFDDDGTWRISGHLPGHEGALIEEALKLCRDQIFRDRDAQSRAAKEGGLDPVLVPEVSWADALVAVADAGLAAKGQGRSISDRYVAFLHIETTPGGDTHGRAHMGPALPGVLRRHLTCDGRVRPVFETGGTPINVGRTQRVVPDRLRWLIEDRDRGCRVPGCTIRHVEVHHIAHWEDGGATDTVNLVALCPAHHKMHHQGLLQIAGDPDQRDSLEFRLANGRRVRLRPPKPPPPDKIDHARENLGLPAPNWNHPSGESYDPDLVWFRPPPDKPPGEPPADAA